MLGVCRKDRYRPLRFLEVQETIPKGEIEQATLPLVDTPGWRFLAHSEGCLSVCHWDLTGFEPHGFYIAADSDCLDLAANHRERQDAGSAGATHIQRHAKRLFRFQVWLRQGPGRSEGRHGPLRHRRGLPHHHLAQLHKLAKHL